MLIPVICFVGFIAVVYVTTKDYREDILKAIASNQSISAKTANIQKKSWKLIRKPKTKANKLEKGY